MIIENKNYKIELCSKPDITTIADIYNSNPSFLSAYINQESVSINWIKIELDKMKKNDFTSAKIIDKSTKHFVFIYDTWKF